MELALKAVLFSAKYKIATIIRPKKFSNRFPPPLQGLFLLQSVVFFHLEAKNTWLLDDLKRLNRIHISITSAAICVGSNNEFSCVAEKASKPPLVTATCI
jgi:hypothetical protein